MCQNGMTWYLFVYTEFSSYSFAKREDDTVPGGIVKERHHNLVN